MSIRAYYMPARMYAPMYYYYYAYVCVHAVCIIAFRAGECIAPPSRRERLRSRSLSVLERERERERSPHRSSRRSHGIRERSRHDRSYGKLPAKCRISPGRRACEDK